MKLIKLITLLSLFIPLSALATGAKKVLIVVTNHKELGSTGIDTGYYLPEVTHPYFKFVEAGFDVTFASPKGGYAPMDPKSLDLKDSYNKKFYDDKKLMGKLNKTMAISDLKAQKFDAIFFAGGHGTMWDFPDSQAIKNMTAKIYESGGVISAVCHGPAALANIKLSNGKYLVDGKKVTAFTNEEEDIVKLTKQMPFLLETKLKKRGAIFVGAKAWQESVIVDQRLVTGQNPASAGLLGEEVVKLLQ